MLHKNLLCRVGSIKWVPLSNTGRTCRTKSIIKLSYSSRLHQKMMKTTFCESQPTREWTGKKRSIPKIKAKARLNTDDPPEDPPACALLIAHWSWLPRLDWWTFLPHTVSVAHLGDNPLFFLASLSSVAVFRIQIVYHSCPPPPTNQLPGGVIWPFARNKNSLD